jgi:hypothetical protein
VAIVDRWPNGYVKVWTADGQATQLPRSSYDQLTASLRDGRDFWEGEDAFGDTTFLRCTEVTMVQDVSPEGLKAFLVDQEARRLEEGDGHD